MQNQSFLYPQEIEVFYIIPAIKRQLALSLKTQGLKQKDIAQLLRIEDATVSQYINNKRGTQVTFSPAVKKEVAKAATRIKDTLSLLKETQYLIRLVKNTGILCQMHKKLVGIPANCTPKKVSCFEEQNGSPGLCH